MPQHKSNHNKLKQKKTMSNPEKKTFPKFWNLAIDSSSGTGVIDIYGEIRTEKPRDWCGDAIEGNYYTNEDFKRDIAACEGLRHVTVNINSYGGDLFLGIAIHNALKALPCKVTTVIRGIAASAASVIFCAGDERHVYPGSVLMIHGVACELWYVDSYNEKQVTELQEELEGIKKAIATMNSAVASIYSATTGLDKDVCLELISDGAERWMDGADTLAEGWATGYAADGYKPQLRMVACANKTHLYSGSRLLSEDFRAPKGAKALGIVSGDNPSNTMSNKNTTTPPQDGTGSAPAAAVPAPAAASADAVAEAVKADRTRIARIDALADKMSGAVSADLIAAAKYGAEDREPMSPEAFAMAAIEAMPADAFKAASHSAARAEELAANAVPTASADLAKDFADPNSRDARRARLCEQIKNYKN